MTEYKNKDFVKVNYNMYANGSLVQTTDAKLGKANNIEAKKFEPVLMVVGKAMILSAVDKAIESGKAKETLELSAVDAYGKRDKKLIRTFPKSAFEEHKMRPVPGVVYDFNGMYGTVKSVTGGRVMVDFNSPLAGKEIKIEYEVIETIEDVKTKIEFVFENILRLPKTYFETEVKAKDVTLKVPKELIAIKEQLLKSFEEYIVDFKDFKFEFVEKKVKVPKKAN